MPKSEEELRKWRDDLVNSKTIRDGVWYPHPDNPNYEGNTEGQLRNKKSGKLRNGSHDKTGRTSVTLPNFNSNKKYQFHRALIECFYETKISLDYDIDHVDQNPGNNKFNNLQILTKKEHCKKTAEQNPERSKKATKNISQSIISYRVDEDGKIINEKKFDSINQASFILSQTENISTKGIWRRIKKSINTQKCDPSGYYWINVFANNDDLEDEIWRQIPDLRKGMLVSNKGRVSFGYISVPYKTYGSRVGEYFKFSCDRHSINVHEAVCKAFIGPKPTDEHTVDHIDRNPENNSVENLRWADRREQAINRKSIHPIEVYDSKNPGIKLKVFDTATDIAKEYGCNLKAVLRACKFNKNKPVGYSIKPRTTLSVRYTFMTNEEKLKRELDIFEHQTEVARRDKNKRKNNPENLPMNVKRNKSTHTLVLKITFLGETYKVFGEQDPKVLVRLRDEWFNNKVESHKAFIRMSFGF